MKLSAPSILRILRTLYTALTLGFSLPALIGAEAKWETLFDGSDLKAWKTFGRSDDSPIAWAIEDGALTWKKGGGSLLTREKFGDFEIELEWKLSTGGNSGVMFGVDESSEKPWHTGPEIQILDDAVHKDGKNPMTSTGAIYLLYSPLTQSAKRIGEWNALRILVEKGRIRCWQNGILTTEAIIGSDDWNKRVAQSKFAPFQSFSKKSEGGILLQDHGDPVWFRNIRIRKL